MPLMLTIYHNAQCSKSNGVCQLLQQEKIPATIVEYLETPPTAAELKHLLQLLGMKASELIRKNEVLFIEQFEGKALSEEDYLQAMIQYPILIERPIVVNNGKAIIARPPEKVLSFI